MKDESAELLHFDPALLAAIGAPCIDGLFHIRGRFENDEQQHRFLQAFDTNKQRILEGHLGADRKLQAELPAHPVALVWLDRTSVTRDSQLPLRQGLCTPNILQRSSAGMAALLHRQRRAQLEQYRQDWHGEDDKIGMEERMSNQIRGLLEQGQIDLRLLSSMCRLQMEFGMGMMAPKCTLGTTSPLLNRIDALLSRSTQVLGSGTVRINELPVDDLQRALLTLCEPLHSSTALSADVTRQVLSYCTNKLSAEDVASLSSTLPDTLEPGLEFGGNACDIALMNMARIVTRPNVNSDDEHDEHDEHDEQESEPEPPASAAA
jgi:hypothetical protein